MKSSEQKQISKFLSLVLRHKPETIGLVLDDNGWAKVDELLTKVNLGGKSLTLDQLTTVVENNDKKRFAFSDDRTKIRANQGHSIKVDLALDEAEPPEVLYHGTAKRNLASIREKGLLKGQRHHVHLSSDENTARNVGIRYGKLVVLKIKSQQTQSDGCTFFLSQNGVWLTDYVDPQYIVFVMK
ncbi:MAG: RNA 2'-phosphotransferase [Bacteroidota bacterium]